MIVYLNCLFVRVSSICVATKSVGYCVSDFEKIVHLTKPREESVVYLHLSQDIVICSYF